MKISDYFPAPMPVESLRELLGYNPLNGDFYWKLDRGRQGGRAKAGKRAGSLLQTGYITICVLGKAYQAHRLAWYIVTGQWPPAQVDHRNRIKNDNRFINLRLATRNENAANRKSSGTASGYRGVYRANQKWRAQVCINSRIMHFGVFDTKEQAYEAVCVAIQDARSEFARID